MRRLTDRVEGADGSDGSIRRAQIVAVIEALGLTGASVVAGVGVVLVVSLAIRTAGVSSTDAVRLLQSRAIRVGFLAVTLAHLALRDRRRGRFGSAHPPVVARLGSSPSRR